jgi:hypothetical protein
MSRTREEIREERRLLKAEYRQLFDEVQSLLFRHDPFGISFESNTDEYDPEVGTILPRLRSCSSAEEVSRIVREEFVRWFGADTAGSRQHYSRIGAEIWELWLKFQSAEPGASPNGGRAKPVGNSGVNEGPPSVS